MVLVTESTITTLRAIWTIGLTINPDIIEDHMLLIDIILRCFISKLGTETLPVVNHIHMRESNIDVIWICKGSLEITFVASEIRILSTCCLLW